MMGDKNILLSVIMPTLNSEKTLSIALESLKKQDFDTDSFEVLVIDGGSTDKTREIAESYGAKILENTEKLPEIAKHIGIQEASGKYAMFLDSDEELINNTSLSRRIELFKNNPDIHAIGPSGIKNPVGYPILSEYINVAGDAFSYFIYGMEGDIYIESCKKLYHFDDFEGYTKFYFSENDTLPIGDGGSFTFDLNYLKDTYGRELTNRYFVSQLFEKSVSKTEVFGILQNDVILHYSTSAIGKYLSKIKWRIINNIFYPDIAGAGFSNRKIPKKILFKKYFFIIYGLSIIFPFLTSLNLSIRKKHFFYILHTYFSFYTAFYIIFYMMWKILRISPPELKTYGK